MKFSYEWLKKYLDTDATPNEIASKLVELGLEVESLDDPATALKGFVYAQVVEREKHPNADRLSLCKVDAGTGELIQVVCGASNVKSNMGVAFASVGTVIPITREALKKGTIRNVDSFGMLCSSKELLLGEESEGIMDLGLDYEPGTPLTNILSTDAIFDLSITPNRGDCFSVYGIARDLAAAGIGTLKHHDLPTIVRQGETPITSIQTDLCSQFSLCQISSVKNGSSPSWLQDLLMRAGQKSISTLVDITNYFCIGLGRPMHVFDADKIQGNIVVRMAKNGEILKALNDQDYILEDNMIVIADNRGVISLAGIMGGRETAVDEKTTNVLLESAYFDPVSIAITGQRLNITSDSRMRFERGVDPTFVTPCLDMATKMVMDLCGGTPSKQSIQGAYLKAQQVINLDHRQVEQRLGLKIEVSEIVNILEKLGCSVDQTASLKITPPRWRHDLTIAEDLIEEIARLKGYHEIPAKSLPLKPIKNLASREELAKKHLCTRGFLETINWSFTDKTSALEFSENQQHLVHLQNPITEDFSVMRPSLLISCLKVAQFNTANARSSGAIFEIAPIYGAHLQHNQTTSIAGLRFGNSQDRHWLSGPPRNVDVFDAKADALSTLKILGVPESSMQLSIDGPSYYHPGRKGTFKQGNRVLAYFGELHPKITNDLNTVGFEIFLDNIHPAKLKKIQATLADLMPVRRDFAFVLDSDIPAATLIKAVERANDLITQVEVFDCYQGSHIEQGKKSLALSITLQPTQKTLDEESLTQIHEAIVQSAAKVNAQLR